MASFGILELLEAMEWQPELAFPASVFLGYVGISSLLQFMRLKSHVKTGGESRHDPLITPAGRDDGRGRG